MLPVNILAREIERREGTRRSALQRRQLRDATDPFSIPDGRFVELFRLNKEMVEYLFHQLEPHLQPATRASAIHPIFKLFAALRFFATGEYQRSIGTSRIRAMSQQATSRCIKEVSRAHK